MYRVEWKKETVGLLIVAAVLIIPVLLYNALPDTIPVHWNIRGQIDRSAAKSPVSVFMIPAIITAAYFLMLLLPFIDPKREKYGQFLIVYRILRISITAVLALIYGYTLLYATGTHIPVNKVIPGLISLLFIIVGNFLGKIRQNWFVGIRFPWTLSSENVWNRTHRLGGRLFVLSGLLGFAGIMFPPLWTFVLLIGSLSVSMIITVWYSWHLYNKEKNELP